jgi:transketolase
MASYQDRLLELARADERIVVVTAENRAVIRGLPPELGPRFVDVGIAEQTMVGIAAGLALGGRIPFCHALATFLTLRAFEFIRTDVGIAGLPVMLVGGVPGVLSEANGPTHQALEDIALMRGIPGMQVFCPADGAELLDALPALVQSGKPCYLRYYDGPAVVEHCPFSLGEAEVWGDGEVALITAGFLLREALAARAHLKERGVDARLVNLRTVKPLDERAVLEAARSARLVVTIEDHFLTGGIFSAVSELLARTGTAARVLPIAFDERWFRPGLLAAVLEHEGLTGPQIATRVHEALPSA